MVRRCYQQPGRDEGPGGRRRGPQVPGGADQKATLLTGTEWRYLKVPQQEFEKFQPTEFADLAVLVALPLI